MLTCEREKADAGICISRVCLLHVFFQLGNSKYRLKNFADGCVGSFHVLTSNKKKNEKSIQSAAKPIGTLLNTYNQTKAVFNLLNAIFLLWIILWPQCWVLWIRLVWNYGIMLRNMAGNAIIYSMQMERIDQFSPYSKTMDAN